MGFEASIQGPEGASMLRNFHSNAKDKARLIGDAFMNLLEDEGERDFIAGRLKYVGADLHILDGCARAAATTDGRCRRMGLECMASVHAELQALEYTLGLSLPKEDAA